MPQGYTESPTIYAAAVNLDLADLHLLGNSTLIQYADDLLLASPSKDVCIKDTLLLLTHLANKGHRASLSKMQYCQEHVQYLGHVLHNGTRQLSQGRITTLLSTTRPQTKKQMMSFLGMANFCRQWIFEYRAMEAVLRNATLNDKPVNIEWSEEINIAFESLQKASSTAPALGLPDYSLPFHLFVSECNGHANGILSQQHCSGKRPVAYYSTSLPPVVLGMPGCLRSVAAAAVMVEKSSPIVLDHDCTIYVPHAVKLLLNSAATQHFTNARRTGYEVILLSKPNLHLKRSPPVNPATLMFDYYENDAYEHPCVETVEQYTSPRPDLKQTPLDNCDLILYTDGSSSRLTDTDYRSGYAVVTDFDIVESASLPPGTSAQLAELYALTRALFWLKENLLLFTPTLGMLSA